MTGIGHSSLSDLGLLLNAGLGALPLGAAHILYVRQIGPETGEGLSDTVSVSHRALTSAPAAAINAP